MARITLYVPDDLKSRMDAAGETKNWSEIARPCIEAALSETTDETAYRHRYSTPILDLSNAFVVIDGKRHDILPLLRMLTTADSV